MLIKNLYERLASNEPLNHTEPRVVQEDERVKIIIAESESLIADLRKQIDSYKDRDLEFDKRLDNLEKSIFDARRKRTNNNTQKRQVQRTSKRTKELRELYVTIARHILEYL